MKEHTCFECKNITWTCTNNGEDYFQRAERLEQIGIDFDSPEYDDYMNVNYL